MFFIFSICLVHSISPIKTNYYWWQYSIYYTINIRQEAQLEYVPFHLWSSKNHFPTKIIYNKRNLLRFELLTSLEVCTENIFVSLTITEKMLFFYYNHCWMLTCFYYSAYKRLVWETKQFSNNFYGSELDG